MTNKDTILVDTWQAKFDMIPVDVELIESKTSKKVKVEVKSQQKPKQQEDEWMIGKPRVVVSEVKNHFDPVNQIVETFERKGITLSKVVQNKKTIAPILENYSNKVDYQGGTKKFIREVIQKLPKE